MKRDLWAFDLYSGMGLASLGFKLAGFAIKAAVEVDEFRCATYERNIGIRPIKDDMSAITGEGILSSAGLKKGELDVLIGCPPCQAFSKLSDTRSIDPFKDRRSKQVMVFAEKVRDVKPKVVVFENVFGLLKGKGKKFFLKYLSFIRNLGYETVYGILDSADFGVPQKRLRLVAISAQQEEIRARLKLPSMSLSPKARTYPKSVRHAIGDLPPLEAGESDQKDPLHVAKAHSPRVLRMIRKIPKDGGNRFALPRRMWLPCHRGLDGADNVYGRMWWDKPAPTITTRCTTPSCGRFLHPEQDRGITLREAFRFQTVPDGFQVRGPQGKVAEMLGDAVPVNLAEALALQCVTLLRRAS